MVKSSHKKLSDPAGSMSTFEKAGKETTDPRIIPVKLDGPAPEGDEITYPDYSAEDQETWKILYQRQRDLLPGRACQEYLDGLQILKFPEDKIPYLGDVGRKFAP